MGKVKKIKEIELLKQQAQQLTQITNSPHFDITFSFTVAFEVKIVAPKLLKFFLPLFWKSKRFLLIQATLISRKKSEHVVTLCAKQFNQIKEKLISSQALLSKYVKNRKEQQELKVPMIQSSYDTPNPMFESAIAPSISKSYIQNQDLQECVVCMARKPDIVLHCLHAFCSECLADWHSRKNDSCPICRGETVGRGGSMKRPAGGQQSYVRKVQSKASYMVIHEGDYMSQMVADIQRNVDAAYEQLLSKLV